MKNLLLLLLCMLPLAARGAAGDFTFLKLNSSGPATEVKITPQNTYVLGWSGGTLVNMARSDVAPIRSITLELPNIFSVAGSPMTASGTFTTTLQTQAANRVLAGPTAGSAAVPTFRALVVDDIPSLVGVYQQYSPVFNNLLMSGEALVQGDMFYFNGTSAVRLPKGTANQVLRINAGATAPEWVTAAADVVVDVTAVGSSTTGRLLTTADGFLEETSITYSTNYIHLGADTVDANAAAQTIVAASATGTDRNGGDLLLKGGNGSGTGTSAVRIFTPAVGSSGTTPSTQTERLRIDSTGLWIENTTTPGSNPPSGSFIIYVDPGDGSLRARGASGTTTILARP